MLAFKREAVAIVVLAFYFLVLDQQTQESRLQQLLLLQHKKRSRRKRLILLQIALRETRRVRRAWSWLRNQFCYTMVLTLPFGLVAFVDRNQTWRLGRKRDRMRLTQSRHHRMWNSMRPQADVSVIQTLVTDLNHALTMPRRVNRTFTLVNFLLSWAVFTRVSVGVYTRKIFTYVS